MNNVILGGDHIRHALADPNFFVQMPEFAALQSKMKTLKLAKGPGCQKCHDRQVRTSLHSDFVGILNSLTNSAMLRFKKYLGTDMLMVNAYDPKTGRTVLKRY